METLRFDVRAAVIAAQALNDGTTLTNDERAAADGFAVGFAKVELPKSFESEFK